MQKIQRNFVTVLEGRLRQSLNFIQVVLGPRQVGKTTGVKEIYQRWAGSKVMASADTIAPPRVEWIFSQWQKARALPKPVLLVLDEVQKVPQWSTAIKQLFDEDRASRDLRVVLLGSASLSVELGLKESLAGRYELLRTPHWDLVECSQAFGWDFETFLQYGGYPAPAELISEPDRWRGFIRDAIIEPVLSRDIQGLARINKPALFRQTFELALHYPAQEVSLNKMLGQLQESGNVSTLQHYLTLFEGAFLLKTLQNYSGSELVSRRSSPKMLPLCPALIHAVIPAQRVAQDPEWRGHIVEVVVGAQLTKSSGKLYYWRKGQFEVDFVVDLDQRLYAIEVKSGRRKSARGPGEFVRRFPAAVPMVIHRDNVEAFLAEEDSDEALRSGRYIQ